MNNREKYFFADFTLDNYRKLLKLALQNYRFVSFENLPDTDEKLIILRHDVEFSLSRACCLAEIESQLGINSTFFFQIHSEFYSIFEKTSMEQIKVIMAQGHKIGLHFDSHFYDDPNCESDLLIFLKRDKQALENYLGTKVKVFSFHNTDSRILKCLKKSYAGMLNVYSDYYASRFAYQSDSTGIWRYERLEDRLKAAKEPNLQVLIHDGMWQDVAMSPRKRVYKCIDERATKTKELYDQTLLQYGHRNIDDE